ncbi:MAG: (2Fe-2S)-binding protein [Thermodesulfobacteriota bacterium]
MINRRIKKGVDRGKSFEIEVDGEKVLAYKGETIAAALLAAGKRTCHLTKIKKQPRGIYCGMGICMGCTMVVNGRPHHPYQKRNYFRKRYSGQPRGIDCRRKDRQKKC